MANLRKGTPCPLAPFKSLSRAEEGLGLGGGVPLQPRMGDESTAHLLLLSLSAPSDVFLGGGIANLIC